MLGLLALASVASAETVRVDMGDGRTAVVRTAMHWSKADPGPAPEDPAVKGNLRFRPDNDANVSLNLTFVSLPDEALADRENLRRFHAANTRQYTSGSVENEVRARDFKTPHGYGVQAQFTDAALVGKPPERDNYKTVTAVFLHLGERVLVIASLFCDDPQGEEYADAMEMLRSILATSARDRA
jgi:hypothetical protein